MNENNKIIWVMPTHIDDSATNQLQSYHAKIATLQEKSHLTLNLCQCHSFDFGGAQILLEIIANARKKNINVSITTANKKLYDLLNFMQFNQLVEIKEEKNYAVS